MSLVVENIKVEIYRYSQEEGKPRMQVYTGTIVDLTQFVQFQNNIWFIKSYST